MYNMYLYYFDQVKTNYLGVSEHEGFMSHAPKNPTCWGCPALSFRRSSKHDRNNGRLNLQQINPVRVYEPRALHELVASFSMFQLHGAFFSKGLSKNRATHKSSVFQQSTILLLNRICLGTSHVGNQATTWECIQGVKWIITMWNTHLYTEFPQLDYAWAK